MAHRLARTGKLIALLLTMGLMAAPSPAAAEQKPEAQTADGDSSLLLRPSAMPKHDSDERSLDENVRWIDPLSPEPLLVQPNDFSYLKLTGTALAPRKSASTYDYSSNGCVFQVGGADFRFQTPVYLPEGASIKYVRMYYVDTAPTDMTVWLTKYQPGQSNLDIVSVQSTGNVGYGTSLSKEIGGPALGDPPAEIVDNATNAYVLTWGTSVLGNTNQICGVRVAYYPPAPGEFNPVTPCRVFNTRVAGPQTSGAPLASPGPYNFRIQGNCGIPNGAKAVALNATVVEPTQLGDLRLFPAGGSQPVVSMMNYPAGVFAMANGAVVPLASVAAPADKDLSVYFAMLASGTIHLIIDVTGYYY
jgi:hypothetical protein